MNASIPGLTYGANFDSLNGELTLGVVPATAIDPSRSLCSSSQYSSSSSSQAAVLASGTTSTGIVPAASYRKQGSAQTKASSTLPGPATSGTVTSTWSKFSLPGTNRVGRSIGD